MWRFYTVYKTESDPPGRQRLLTEWHDEKNHTYIPASLPGQPKSGERVGLWFPRKRGPYTHCSVGEQLYYAVCDSRGWRVRWEPVDSTNTLNLEA